MRCWLPILACLALLIGLSLPSVAIDANESQSQIVHDYLEAYVRNEMPKVRLYLPTKPENLFGPCPFRCMPKLSEPKVDGNQALVEFTASVGDKGIPAKGGLLFYRITKTNTWKVRQVLFYNTIPAIFRLPKRSVNDADRNNEPRVKSVAETFLQAWLNNDTNTMMVHWHNWAAKDMSPIAGLSMTRYSMTVSTTGWDEPFAHYKVRLTYKWGVISYSMNLEGGLLLARENGEWKVRGNMMILSF